MKGAWRRGHMGRCISPSSAGVWATEGAALVAKGGVPSAFSVSGDRDATWGWG